MYILESLRKDGSKKIYTGHTKRTVRKRVGEHILEVKKPESKTWVGRGRWVRLLGAVFSRNVFKAERTIKKMRPTRKRNLAGLGARRYEKKR